MTEENGWNRTDRRNQRNLTEGVKRNSERVYVFGRLRLLAAAWAAAAFLSSAAAIPAFAGGAYGQTAQGQVVSGPGEAAAAAAGNSVGNAAENTAGNTAEKTAAEITSALTFDVNRFVLPEDAHSLITVEGFAVKSGKEVYKTGTSDTSLWNRARVTVFERGSDGLLHVKVQSAGVLGWGGMSNHRHTGDGTTPIGLWKADTPFGRKDALEGFPADYVKIDTAAGSQYWSDYTNRLETNADAASQSGERLYADWAEGIYDYCLNSGFNKDNAQKGTGTALFLHCTVADKPSTAGCVAIDPEAMKEILRIFARGACCIAQAPAGQFDSIYAAYSDTGACASGSFRAPTAEMPETPTVILE